jgi:hypothetical protein
MQGIVTGQRACIGGAVVGDGKRSILEHDVNIKIHQPLAANIRVDASQSVRGVARTEQVKPALIWLWCWLKLVSS